MLLLLFDGTKRLSKDVAREEILVDVEAGGGVSVSAYEEEEDAPAASSPLSLLFPLEDSADQVRKRACGGGWSPPGVPELLSLRSTPAVGVVDDEAGVMGPPAPADGAAVAAAPDAPAVVAEADGVDTPPRELPLRESLSLMLPDLSEMSLGGPVCELTDIFSSSNSMGPKN